MLKYQTNLVSISDVNDNSTSVMSTGNTFWNKTPKSQLLTSTMYTSTDNTDKNLKPNKANMTVFKNLTLWFREFNSEKKRNFQIK